MRITFITNKLNLAGGGENQDVFMKAQALQAKGHEVLVVTAFSKLNNVFGATPFAIKEEQAQSVRLFPLQAFVVRILKKYSPRTDVFYIFSSTFIFGAGWYRLVVKNSKPIIADINGHADFVETYFKRSPLWPTGSLAHEKNLWQSLKYKIRIFLERLIGVCLLNSFDAIVIMTKTMAGYYIRAGVRPDIITVIPSFQDIIAFQNQALQNNPFSQYSKNMFHILFTGRLYIDKGADILIDAFAKFSQPDCMLHIVGEGEQKSELARRVRELGLDSVIKFYPWQSLNDLAGFYQHAHLFVQPGRLPEPMVRTTIEALSFGLPLVVTDTSVEKWLSQEVAEVFKLGDSADLAAKMTEAYQDKQWQKTAAINGRRRALEFDYRGLISLLERTITESAK